MCGCLGVKEDCCTGNNYIFKEGYFFQCFFHELFLLLETQTLLHIEGNSFESVGYLSTVLIECICSVM
jgi:hypothetical protein